MPTEQDKTMPMYRLDVDAAMDDLFYELERLNERGRGHECCIAASRATDAARILAQRLQPFFEKRMKLVEAEKE